LIVEETAGSLAVVVSLEIACDAFAANHMKTPSFSIEHRHICDDSR
jgi:hypothetical protein